MAVYPQSCIATPTVGNSIETVALQQKERRKNNSLFFHEVIYHSRIDHGKSKDDPAF